MDLDLSSYIHNEIIMSSIVCRQLAPFGISDENRGPNYT